MMRRRVAACAVLCGALVFFMPLVLLRGSKRGGGSSHDALQQHHQQQQSPQQHVGEAPDHSQHRRLQQNDFSSSTIPPEFTQLDRAAETQRIYRSVAAEREATAWAVQHPEDAWQLWQAAYNVTYSSPADAGFRRQVFLSNLERADKLNLLVGPEAAFGVNRFSALTPEEFLQRHTGDAQRDSGLTVVPEDPQMLDSPVAPLLADWAAGTFLTPPGTSSGAGGAMPPTGNGNGSASNASALVPPGQLPGAGVQPPGGVQQPGGGAGAPGQLQPGQVPPTQSPGAGSAGGFVPITPGPPPSSAAGGGSAGGLVAPLVRPPGAIPTTPLPGGSGSAPLPGAAPPAALPAPGTIPATAPVPGPGAAGAPPSPAPGGAAPPPSPAAAPAGGVGPIVPGQPGAAPPAAPRPPLPSPAPGLAVPGAPGTPAPGSIPATGRRRQLLHSSQQQEQHLLLAGPQQRQRQQTLGVQDAVASAVRRAVQAWRQLLVQLMDCVCCLLKGSADDSSGSIIIINSSASLEGTAAGQGVGSTPAWYGAGGDDDDGSSTELEDVWQHWWSAARTGSTDHAGTAAAAAAAAAAADSGGGGGGSNWLAPGGRHLQQSFQVPSMACARQSPFLFGRDRPMQSVDWLRQGVVQPGLRDQTNCSNSFAFVAAGLAEATMALLGYNGTARRVSEAQLMACMPDASCSRGATTHVLLNSLACGGFAAAATGPNAFPIADPRQAVPAACAAGGYNPVRTGIVGWSFVPPSELAFAQALSRAPIKVSVDATMLQSYRAGFIGCNMRSDTANHAVLAVGYSQRVRVSGGGGGGGSGGGSSGGFRFHTGGEYWMLRNSWGRSGSVDGFVYVAKGCGGGNVAPLGLLANRGAMALFNASSTYGVGRLQCTFPEQQPEPGCSRDLLLKLSSFCARVPEPFPLRDRTNCSCSCVPA